MHIPTHTYLSLFPFSVFFSFLRGEYLSSTPLREFQLYNTVIKYSHHVLFWFFTLKAQSITLLLTSCYFLHPQASDNHFLTLPMSLTLPFRF